MNGVFSRYSLKIKYFLSVVFELLLSPYMLGIFKKHMAVFKNTKKCKAQKKYSKLIETKRRTESSWSFIVVLVMQCSTIKRCYSGYQHCVNNHVNLPNVNLHSKFNEYQIVRCTLLNFVEFGNAIDDDVERSHEQH